MAWGKKDDELPARLRGKTPEQIAQELEAADGLKTKIEGLEAGLNDQKTKFETFGASLTQLNDTLKTLGERLPTGAKPAGGDGDGEKPQPASFLTEPDRAFAEHAAPLVGVVLNTAARLAREEAFRKAQARQRTEKGNIDGFLFEKFGKEIDDFAKTCTPQQVADPATWEHLFFNVKGRHGDEIAAQRVEGKGEFFVEGSGGRVASADEHKDEVKLTPLEEKLAQRMGVKTEDYLKRKKEMQTGAIAEELLTKVS